MRLASSGIPTLAPVFALKNSIAITMSTKDILTRVLVLVFAKLPNWSDVPSVLITQSVLVDLRGAFRL